MSDDLKGTGVLTIRRAGHQEAVQIVTILRAAFHPVATEFGLTRENCPTHTSFAEPEWIVGEFDQGVHTFLAVENGVAVGCVALRLSKEKGAKLKRLAVLPAFQGRGIGQSLVQHSELEARQLGLKSIEVGVITQHHRLRRWYRKQSYVESHQETYKQLPFIVQFLIKHLV